MGLRRLVVEREVMVRLPDSLAARLEEAALRLGREQSDIIRMALEEFLTITEERPIERVRDLLGQIESGIPDLGQRHREHLLRRVQRGRHSYAQLLTFNL